MKKFSLILITALFGLSLLTSCRPPELEGAFVDYNAGRYDNALVLAKEAVAKYPQNGEAWLLLGRLHGKNENIKEMIPAFDKAAVLNKLYEKEVENEKTYYFQTMFNKGVNSYNAFTKFEDRSSEKAIQTIDKAIDNFQKANLIKKDYKTTDLLAACYNMSARPDEALTQYIRLTEIEPDSADSWIAVGTFHFYAKDYNKAIDNLGKALELDQNNIEAITLISQSYDMLDDTDNALKAYEKAKVLNSEEKAFPYNLGLIYNKLVNKEGLDEATKSIYFDKMIENFGDVIRLDPNIKVPFQMKSFAEIQMKKYDDAVNTINSGIEQFPDDGSLWFNLGVAYTHLQNKIEAKKAFDKASEFGYDN